MNRQQAVNLAIAELGDGTSVEELRERASEIYGKDIKYGTVVVERCIWRKRVGKVRDSRMHKYQKGRSERDIFQVNKIQLRALFNFEATKNPTAKDALALVSKFDSIQQFTNAIKKIKNLKVVQPFSIDAPKVVK
jgi:hypothetical protein